MKWIIVLLLCLPASAQTWFSNVKVSPSTNSCTLAWTTAVPTIGHVNYGLAVNSYAYHTTNSSTYSTNNSAVLSGLTAATTYHFRIVSADASKDWIQSLDTTCATTSTTTQHSVQLNWQASTSTGVTGYDVYRSTTAGGYFSLLASITGLTFTDKAVQAGATYYYVVTAVNSSGLQSKYSNQFQALIP